MADLEEIMDQVATLVAGIIYPEGAADMVPPCVKIYPRWPTATGLANDMKAGSVNISVYPLGSDKNVTRYPREWKDIFYAAKTLTATVEGNKLTLGGTVMTPLNVGVRFAVDGQAPQSIAYALQAGDTLASIATALAQLIGAICPASSSGPEITLTGGNILAVKLGGSGTQMRELKRQQQDIAITIWAPTPTARKETARTLDARLAALTYITLIDTQAARWTYKRTLISDSLENSKVFRRDLVYQVEYATTETHGANEITFVDDNLTGTFPGVPAEFVPPTIAFEVA